jgi:thymidine kinase
MPREVIFALFERYVAIRKNPLQSLNLQAMFIEPHLGKKSGTGWIEVICGCMFSGKTEELIRRLNRAIIAGQKVEIFKPAIDVRYHRQLIVSHNESTIRSTAVQFAGDLMLLSGDCDVVGIDEAQFFDNAIVDICNTLANEGKRVIVAGLDMDYKGKPFGPMPQLLAIAEYVTKLHAICARTGELASFSFRLAPGDEQIVLGERTQYEARSRKAFIEGMAKRKTE